MAELNVSAGQTSITLNLTAAVSGAGGGVTDHTGLTSIGTNTHAQLDTHVADSTLHYVQAAISITESQISDLQSYSLDSHNHAGTYLPISSSIKALNDVYASMTPVDGQVLTFDATNGWQAETPATVITDHTGLSSIGTNTHAQLDTHVADSTLHFTQAAISITESQISDLQSYSLDSHNHDGIYSLTAHDHDGEYFTELEIQNIVAAKQDIINGFPNRTDSTISFSPGSRTFTIAPTGASYDVYTKHVTPATKSSSENIVIPNTNGLHLIYFDEDAVLSSTQTPSDSIILDWTFIAYVYWNADNSELVSLGEERHGYQMAPQTHLYLHEAFGTQYISGLALTDIISEGSGDLDTHIQCGYGAGVIRDEDIEHVIAADAGPADIPLYWKEGANGVWRREVGNVLAKIGTTLAAWNEWTGATWQLTDADNNDFILCHLFATGDDAYKVIGIIGQAEYNTTALARAGAESEINSLILSDLPFQEFSPIASVIIQTSTGYTNVVKSRIMTTNDGEDWVDFRQNGLSASAAPGSHSNLADLTSDDHAHYALADGSRSPLTQINTQTGATYQLVLTDAGKYIRGDNGASFALTVPPNSTVAFDIGTSITLHQAGAGQFTVVEGAGVTVNSAETLALRAQHSSATLIKYDTDSWDLLGDLEETP